MSPQRRSRRRKRVPFMSTKKLGGEREGGKGYGVLLGRCPVGEPCAFALQANHVPAEAPTHLAFTPRLWWGCSTPAMPRFLVNPTHLATATQLPTWRSRPGCGGGAAPPPCPPLLLNPHASHAAAHAPGVHTQVVVGEQHPRHPLIVHDGQAHAHAHEACRSGRKQGVSILFGSKAHHGGQALVVHDGMMALAWRLHVGGRADLS